MNANSGSFPRVVLGSVLVMALLGACSSRSDSIPAAERSTIAPATTSVAVTTAAAPPAFAATECTSATATTRQVIERYFALSTSSNAQAVTDCFAKAWRDRNGTGFADSVALWSQSGPATNLVITFGDAVNGCDRFNVSAQMQPDSFWMRGQSGGHAFLSVGAEAGRMRIYETSSALTNPSSTVLRCG